MTESNPVRPTGNPYTDMKIASEHRVLLAGAAGRPPVTVIRPGDVYGPGSVPWTIRPVQMMRARQFAHLGDVGVLSPVYLDDVVTGGLAAARSEAGVGQVFHLSSGVRVAPSEFFGRYAAMLRVRVPTLPHVAVCWVLAPALGAAFGLAGRDAPISSRTLEYVTHPGTYSITKARELPGWEPVVDLDAGMRRTEAWLRVEGLLG